MQRSTVEWDEAKRLVTLRKHGIDFIDAIEIFASDHIILEASSDVEVRKRAVGLVEGVPFAVVYTLRDDAIRIITARRARRDEREEYYSRFPRGGAQAQE